jgi:TolA-binding protein
MKRRMKSFLLSTSSAIAIALLAFSFAVVGSHTVRADEPENLSLPVQDSVLMAVKDVQALEHRVIHLEETVAALAESWQRINTHRLCVSDDSGAETCITKPQLDAFLISQTHAAVAGPSASVVGGASAPTSVESVAVVTATDNSEPAPSAVSSDVSPQDNQQPIQIAAAPAPLPTGSVAITASADASEGATAPVLNEASHNDQQPAQTGAVTLTAPATELNMLPDAETSAPGDLP